MDREAFAWLTRTEDFLTPYLDQLIESNGGDGNGAASLNKRGNVGYIKGTMLTSADIVGWMRSEYRAGAQSLTFHCRRATIGEVTTSNCHPFQYGSNKKATILVHNGHDSLLQRDAKYLGYWAKDRPDSDAACWLAHELGPDTLKDYSGNFAGYSFGKPFLIIGEGYWPMWRMLVGKSGVIHCSERPAGLDSTCYRATSLGRVRPVQAFPVAYGYDANYIPRMASTYTMKAWGPKTTRILTFDELEIPEKERYGTTSWEMWHSLDKVISKRRKHDAELREELLAWVQSIPVDTGE